MLKKQILLKPNIPNLFCVPKRLIPNFSYVRNRQCRTNRRYRGFFMFETEHTKDLLENFCRFCSAVSSKGLISLSTLSGHQWAYNFDASRARTIFKNFNVLHTLTCYIITQKFVRMIIKNWGCGSGAKKIRERISQKITLVLYFLMRIVPQLWLYLSN